MSLTWKLFEIHNILLKLTLHPKCESSISRWFCNYCLLSVSATNEDLPLLNFRWHIFPNINPDGHTYTHNVDRFWSKNRRQNKSGVNCTVDLTDCCNGVNINRNFPSGFGFGPTDPCDRLIPFFANYYYYFFSIQYFRILFTYPPWVAGRLPDGKKEPLPQNPKRF